MKTKTIKPCGYLFAGFETFLLLSPEPVVKDSWQDSGTYRFVCVPGVPMQLDEDGQHPIYDYARHIVTNNFTIEYVMNMQPIEVKILEEDYE